MVWDSNFQDIRTSHVILPIKRDWQLQRGPTFSTSAYDQNSLNLSFRARSFPLPISIISVSIFVLNLVPSTVSCSSDGLLRYGSINWSVCGRNASHFPVVKLFENSSGRNFNRHAWSDNILVNRVKNNDKRIKEMFRYLIQSSWDRLGLKAFFDAHRAIVSAKWADPQISGSFLSSDISTRTTNVESSSKSWKIGRQLR
jgi:hypothetical protein